LFPLWLASNEGFAMSATLITGFPRLLAKEIAGEVLRTHKGPVYLLVRERYTEDARRFAMTLHEGNRVTVITGDVTSIDMGLSGSDYLNLARTVTLIHHAAQGTHDGADARHTRTLNIEGAREIVEFARTVRSCTTPPRIVAYSSTLIAGDHEGLVREEALEAGQRFRTEVERSLYEAERVFRSVANEFPITIARPSVIVGHSVTGEIDVLDGPYSFVILLLSSPVDINLPLPSRGGGTLHVVPVDYVARAGVALGNNPAAISRTVHLIDGAPLPARKAFDLVAGAAGRRLAGSILPLESARSLLKTPVFESLARSPRAFIERLSARAFYTDETARELLVPAGIVCPPFDQYVGVLVEHVRRRMATRRTRSDAITQEPEIDDPLA
jgi:thioester reductase-like protein